MPDDVLKRIATAVHEARPAQPVITNGRWSLRIGAAAIDVILMLLFAFLPTLCILFIHLDYIGIPPEHDIAGEWIALAATCLLSIVYLLSEVIFATSLGKWELRMRVFSADGEMTRMQRLLRFSIKALPLLALLVVSSIAYIGLNRHQLGHPLPDVKRFHNGVATALILIPLALLILDLGWMLFDPQRRPLHDRAAGTFVGEQVRSTRPEGFEPVLAEGVAHEGRH